MVTRNTVNQYDDLNRLTSATDNTYSPAKILGYAYYEDGTRQAMTDTANAIAVTYTYDKAKRLYQVKRNGSTIGTYLWNALGLRTRLTFGNYAWTEYGYNTVTRWLTSVINKRWTAHNIIASSFAYQHDKVGNRKIMTLYGGAVVTYVYDNVYQLKSEVRTVASPYIITWNYDSVGNRIDQTRNGVLTTYTCNDANQLVSEITNGLTTNYLFDANGNMTVKKVGGVTVAQWGYDWENRQTAYTDLLNPLNNSTYGYDALGRRVSKTVNGVTEKYVLDGANVIADYDGANALKATYVTPFLDDNLLVVSGTVKHYYMHDGLGCVRNLIRSSDQYLSNKYDYYAFGETLNQTEGITNRYKFTGREWDGESSTYHYRARQYNPSAGRFTRSDPIGYIAGINLYSYVNNDPINYTDPYGLDRVYVNTENLLQQQENASKRAKTNTDRTLNISQFYDSIINLNCVKGSTIINNLKASLDLGQPAIDIPIIAKKAGKITVLPAMPPSIAVMGSRISSKVVASHGTQVIQDLADSIFPLIEQHMAPDKYYTGYDRMQLNTDDTGWVWDMIGGYEVRTQSLFLRIDINTNSYSDDKCHMDSDEFVYSQSAKALSYGYKHKALGFLWKTTDWDRKYTIASSYNPD